jgi:hypothetical protein
MPNPDLAELDVGKLEQLESALAAERERRNDEWRAARVSAGNVVRLIADLRLGETVAGVVAAHKAAHPGDCFVVVRTIYDAPEVRPDPPPAPVDPVPDPWAEPLWLSGNSPQSSADTAWPATV